MVHKLCLNPDVPQVFYSCCEDGFVRYYDVREKHSCARYGRCRHTALVQDPGNELNSISINPVHPVHFVTAGNDKVVRCYDLRFLKPMGQAKNSQKLTVAEYKASRGGSRFTGITGVAYSRDGSEIVATYSGDSVFLFDAASPHTGGTELDVPSFIRTSQSEDAISSSSGAGQQPDQQQQDAAAAERYQTLTQWKMRWVRSRFEENKQSSDEADLNLDEEAELVYIPEKASFSGHVNTRTVKEVNFYGPNSEYVISGRYVYDFFNYFSC
eukprot:TRINITY_DN8179_c0_g1_i3.p1 TRINITY_DN8179_c0_g1~~TRINITY_DN8179_c0_g1_i3.p1  ORF type:complete len:269 (-),score=70.25 TRINITY_DN8179_c0_g1_i3:486-1292(-)